MDSNFSVFGEPVEVLLNHNQSDGRLVVVTQTCRPGGGPPPHRHEYEDELFQTVSGRFELFDGATDSWAEIPPGRVIFSPRGSTHTFRNCGDSDGTIQIVVSGSNLDEFLFGLSRFEIPRDLQPMIDYSATFGITYPTLPPPTPVERRELAAQ
jgi:quercetin dioxygenase-like cupin family protein